jgi:hypothetical protein
VTDGYPACYRGDNDKVKIPDCHLEDFLSSELSLGRLEVLHRHLWFAGAKRPPKPLHYQIQIGREIIITEQMDLHLLWANDGRIFIKPLPRFLLDPQFWSRSLSCLAFCRCNTSVTETDENNSKGRQFKPLANPPSQECLRRRLRKCALGFLYTYACLISYESDFYIATNQHLLPHRTDGSSPDWEDWKNLVGEILACQNEENVHPRFYRAELRLSRLDTIHRFTQFPPFEPYLRGRRNYGSLFRDNLTWLATATVFIALVLTAMQVGLATDQLKDNKSFMATSYGFTIFAILGPLCAFSLVVLDALYHLVKDLPWLLRKKPNLVIDPALSADQVEAV